MGRGPDYRRTIRGSVRHSCEWRLEEASYGPFAAFVWRDEGFGPARVERKALWLVEHNARTRHGENAGRPTSELQDQPEAHRHVRAEDTAVPMHCATRLPVGRYRALRPS